MARHRINTPTPTATGDIVNSVASEMLAKQKWFQLRKNSLVQFATGSLQVISLLGFFIEKLPAEFTLATNIVVFVLGVIIQASMKGVMTPSLAEKITLETDAAMQNEPTVSSISGDELPVYNGELSS